MHLNTYTYKRVYTYALILVSEDNKWQTQKLNTKIGYSLITKTCKQQKKWLNLGRINVDISDEIEKKLRLKTVEKFGGKKGDLSRAVQEAIKTWINQKE